MDHTRTAKGWVREIGAAPGEYRPADQPSLPSAWWRLNRRYTLYMWRELSSVFVAVWSLLFLKQLSQVRHGAAAYEASVAARRRPAWIAFHVVTLGFAVVHSITFLLAAGKGPTLRMRGHRVPERAVAAGAFAGWVGASLVVLLVLLLGGRRETEEAEGAAG